MLMLAVELYFTLIIPASSCFMEPVNMADPSAPEAYRMEVCTVSAVNYRNSVLGIYASSATTNLKDQCGDFGGS